VSTLSANPSKANGKQRAFQRTTIEVPRGNSDIEDHELDDEDLGIIKQFGAGASFLQTLDEKGISKCVFPLTVIANVNAHSELGVSGSWTVCVAWTGLHVGSL
jgi:hypothetical protein